MTIHRVTAPTWAEPCENCAGSGLVIGDGGDPRLCPKCKGDTVQPPLSPAAAYLTEAAKRRNGV